MSVSLLLSASARPSNHIITKLVRKKNIYLRKETGSILYVHRFMFDKLIIRVL